MAVHTWDRVLGKFTRPGETLSADINSENIYLVIPSDLRGHSLKNTSPSVVG